MNEIERQCRVLHLVERPPPPPPTGCSTQSYLPPRPAGTPTGQQELICQRTTKKAGACVKPRKEAGAAQVLFPGCSVKAGGTAQAGERLDDSPPAGVSRSRRIACGWDRTDRSFVIRQHKSAQVAQRPHIKSRTFGIVFNREAEAHTPSLRPSEQEYPRPAGEASKVNDVSPRRAMVVSTVKTTADKVIFGRRDEPSSDGEAASERRSKDSRRCIAPGACNDMLSQGALVVGMPAVSGGGQLANGADQQIVARSASLHDILIAWKQWTRRISNGDALTAQRLALRDDSVDAVVFGNDAESHGCSLANQEPFKQAAGMATDQCGMQADGSGLVYLSED
ncbi:MAG: hypothetical protein SGPRY_000295 [Prymnesium sp.]